MTDPTQLTPVAQAVLDAYGHYSGGTGCILDYELRGVAAALRAVADQVVPEHPMVVPGGRSYESAWSATVQEDIRKKFLAIAAELEAT